MKICLSVSKEYINVTDRWTSHNGKGHAYCVASCSKNILTVITVKLTSSIALISSRSLSIIVINSYKQIFVKDDTVTT